jgi:uncharacterized protein
MGIQLTAKETEEIDKIFREVCENSRLMEMERYTQHGHTSVLRHCLSVAYTSYWLAARLGIETDERALVRGALLHDYFLYDWHTPHEGHDLHGFTHAKTAWRNAKRDVPDLTPREENVILRHMFPLTPVPPTCREAWLVWLADKICAARETEEGIANHIIQKEEHAK